MAEHIPSEDEQLLCWYLMETETEEDRRLFWGFLMFSFLLAAFIEFGEFLGWIGGYFFFKRVLKIPGWKALIPGYRLYCEFGYAWSGIWGIIEALIWGFIIYFYKVKHGGAFLIVLIALAVFTILKFFEARKLAKKLKLNYVFVIVYTLSRNMVMIFSLIVTIFNLVTKNKNH